MKKHRRNPFSVLILGTVLAVFSLLLLLQACSPGGGSKTATPTATEATATTSTPATQTEWFQGGTLHKATLAQWRVATNANKLATAADWLAATEWKGHLNRPSDFDRLKVKAQMLVNAVNESASDRDLGAMSATEVAAAILTMSNDLGP